MRTFTITIWKFKVALHTGNFQFDTDGEARNYALGLFAGIQLMGGEPTGIETNEVVGEDEVENPMCEKYPDSEALPDESGACSLCGGDCVGL